MSALHLRTQGQGPAVVLLHGWAMHALVWGGFPTLLAERRQVICPDLPGHGLSAPSKLFDSATLCALLAEALPQQRFDLLGWSLGAVIAVEFAARYPARVRSLTLLCGSPRFSADASWPGVAPALLDDFALRLATDAGQLLKRFIALQAAGVADAKVLCRQLQENWRRCAPADGATLRASLQLLRQADARPMLAQVSCPVRVILGAEDRLIPAAAGGAMRALNPAIALSIVPRASHVLFLSHAAWLAQCLLV